MNSGRTARPPSSQRREPDLDSPHAKQFVEAVGNSVAPSASGVATGGEGSTAPNPIVPPRRGQLRPLTLRIPEELHTALTYIAENSNRSMNQFAIDVLTPAVEVQMVKIAKRKELGLD